MVDKEEQEEEEEETGGTAFDIKEEAGTNEIMAAAGIGFVCGGICALGCFGCGEEKEEGADKEEEIAVGELNGLEGL